MLVEIINWEKYNPRHDVKHTTWFRLENTFWADDALTKLDNDGKMVWLLLLSFASQKQTGEIGFDAAFAASVLKMEMVKVEQTLNHLQANKKIRIRTSRRRNGRVTRTVHERDAHVPLRDGTDETLRNDSPLNPPRKRVGHQERERRRVASETAKSIATKAIGALRAGLPADEAETFVGRDGFQLALVKYGGAWEQLRHGYAIATREKRGGGSDATFFETELAKSIKALLIVDAPANYQPKETCA